MVGLLVTFYDEVLYMCINVLLSVILGAGMWYECNYICFVVLYIFLNSNVENDGVMMFILIWFIHLFGIC